jgi:hypothetical protein
MTDDDELEIPRAKRVKAEPKAETPAKPVTTVKFNRAIHLNGDAFLDSMDPRPRDMKPGDVAGLKPHRAEELLRRGVVSPA